MATPQADAILAELERTVRTGRNDVAIEITANLMEPPDEGGTPVKTGWARANWVPSHEDPTSSPAGTPDAVSAAAVEQQAGIARVAGFQGDGPVYVTNNVPYIQQLNDGSSKQAPSGFVEAAIDKAIVTLQSGAPVTMTKGGGT